jgi:hypothetical protein
MASIQQGKRQHVYAYPVGKQRGPGGYLIWDCERCGIQKTIIKQAGFWRMTGEDWKSGFVGCTPKAAGKAVS